MVINLDFDACFNNKRRGGYIDPTRFICDFAYKSLRVQVRFTTSTSRKTDLNLYQHLATWALKSPIFLCSQQ